ncbi:hypothetical protein D3C78_1112490 [compost metagenome]
MVAISIVLPSDDPPSPDPTLLLEHPDNTTIIANKDKTHLLFKFIHSLQYTRIRLPS